MKRDEPIGIDCNAAADDFSLLMLEETLTESIFNMCSMDGELRNKSAGCTGRGGNASTATGDPNIASATAASFDELLQCSQNKSLSDHSITYLSNVVEDSEGTQRKAMEKGTYFKTGLYNPLKKDLNGVFGSGTNVSDGLFGVGLRLPVEQKSIFNQPPAFSVPPPEIATVMTTEILPATPPSILEHLSCLDLGTSVVGNSGKCSYNSRSIAYSTAAAPDAKQLQPEQLHQFNSRCNNAGRADTYFMDLLTKICCVSEAEYFFVEQFTKNYVSWTFDFYI